MPLKFFEKLNLFLFKKKFLNAFSFNFWLQRLLVHDYRSPYVVREKIYKAINIWNSRLNKYVPTAYSASLNIKSCASLMSQGILLNTFDIHPTKAQSLLDLLFKMNSKEINSSTGQTQKIVYSQADIVKSLDFLEIACSPRVVDVATQYLGVPPIIAFISAWTTFSSDSETNEMFFHMDHHGHRFLKLFYYLTDVEIGSGHHEFCRSTHNQVEFDKIIHIKDNPNGHFRNAILSKRKYQGGFRLEKSLVYDFIPERVLQVAGKPGTSFIEDTRGLHRGTLLKQGSSRTILQVLYLPNYNLKDTRINFPANEALSMCRESSTLHPIIFDRLFSNIFSKQAL